MSSLPSLTWWRIPAPVICIPAYEAFSLQSVGSGKRLSVHIGIVRKTSWSLFLTAPGLWTESDSFLCCIFSPLVFRASIAQWFFFSSFLPPWHKINRGCHHLKEDTTGKKKTKSLVPFTRARSAIFYEPLHLVMCDGCVNPSPAVPNIQPSVWRNPVIRDLESQGNTKSSSVSTELNIWTRSHSHMHE